jgi:hypothetical protein
VYLFVASVSARAAYAQVIEPKAEKPEQAATLASCVSAYENVQTAMKRGQLAAAREQVRVCLDGSCSRTLRSDCATWLTEIDTRQPSLVVGYQDARGTSRSDVVVFVDGLRVAKSLNGSGLAIDPGPHVVRIEPTAEKPMEERRVFQDGKVETMNFMRAPIAVAAPRQAPERPIPATAWTAFGVAALGAVSFATFAIWGRLGQNTLDGCRPDCPGDDVSGVRTRYTVADVSLGVTFVGLAAATLFYLFRPNVTQGAQERATRLPAQTARANAWLLRDVAP